MHSVLCTAAAPWPGESALMLEGCSEKLRYFVQSLLLKEWPLLQRSNPASWRARKVVPATGFPIPVSVWGNFGVQATWFCLSKRCRNGWKVTFQKLEHCFGFFLLVRAAPCHWLAGTDREPNPCCSMLLGARWQHLWRKGAGSGLFLERLASWGDRN